MYGMLLYSTEANWWNRISRYVRGRAGDSPSCKCNSGIVMYGMLLYSTEANWWNRISRYVRGRAGDSPSCKCNSGIAMYGMLLNSTEKNWWNRISRYVSGRAGDSPSCKIYKYSKTCVNRTQKRLKKCVLYTLACFKFRFICAWNVKVTQSCIHYTGCPLNMCSIKRVLLYHIRRGTTLNFAVQGGGGGSTSKVLETNEHLTSFSFHASGSTRCVWEQRMSRKH